MANRFIGMMEDLDPRTARLVAAISGTPENRSVSVQRNDPRLSQTVEADKLARAQAQADKAQQTLSNVPKGLRQAAPLVGVINSIAAQMQRKNDNRTLEELYGNVQAQEAEAYQRSQQEKQEAKDAAQQQAAEKRALDVADAERDQQWKIDAENEKQAAIARNRKPEEESPAFDADLEGKFRKELTDATKDFAKINDSFGRIQAAYQDPSPAGDMALVFSYMKTLDPGSTVREGEYATAENAASIPVRVRQSYNKALTGNGLDPTQREDFYSRAGKLYKQAESEYDQRVEGFSETMSNYSNVRPEAVIRDRALHRGWEYQEPTIPEAAAGNPASSFAEGTVADGPNGQLIFTKDGWVPNE